MFPAGLTAGETVSTMRADLVQTFPEFELLSDRVVEHAGAQYWLASLRALQPGEFVFRRHFETPDWGYRHHDNQMQVVVGERGCKRELGRDLRPQPLCVGDVLILPIQVGPGVVHRRFRRDNRFREFLRSPFALTLDRSTISAATIRPELDYLGRFHFGAAHRGGDQIRLDFIAVFEAQSPGRLSLQLQALWLEPAGAPTGAVVERAIEVLPADAPITALVAHESVWQSDEDSENPRVSSSGGTGFPVTVLQLRPGDRFALDYGGATVPTRSELAAQAARVVPRVRRSAFVVDPAEVFNRWLP